MFESSLPKKKKKSTNKLRFFLKIFNNSHYYLFKSIRSAYFLLPQSHWDFLLSFSLTIKCFQSENLMRDTRLALARAMLSPPRLPALCIAFHAGACVTSERASTGLTHA
jgi:hypothetical protein